MRGAKSDAVMAEENFRLEMKSTIHDSMGLELGWLVKIATEARTSNQIPALIVSFVDANGDPRTRANAEWVAIPKWAFEDLLVRE